VTLEPAYDIISRIGWWAAELPRKLAKLRAIFPGTAACPTALIPWRPRRVPRYSSCFAIVSIFDPSILRSPGGEQVAGCG